MSTTPAPGTALRDFTVAELEGLPVGATFHCPIDATDTYRDIVKQPDGSWEYDDGSGWECSADFQGECEMYSCANHVLRSDAQPEEAEDDPADPTIGADPTADLTEALMPFAAYAAIYVDTAPDDAVVMRHGDTTLTIGDFRRAARVVGGAA